jgi:hypothetical protein
MRVLKNSAVARSEQGSMPPKQLIGETVVFGRSYKMPANSAVLPTTQTRGDHEEMCLAAGASVAALRSIEPADQIVRDMMTDAWALIGGKRPALLFVPNNSVRHQVEFGTGFLPPETDPLKGT